MEFGCFRRDLSRQSDPGAQFQQKAVGGIKPDDNFHVLLLRRTQAAVQQGKAQCVRIILGYGGQIGLDVGRIEPEEEFCHLDTSYN